MFVRLKYSYSFVIPVSRKFLLGLAALLIIVISLILIVLFGENDPAHIALCILVAIGIGAAVVFKLLMYTKYL